MFESITAPISNTVGQVKQAAGAIATMAMDSGLFATLGDISFEVLAGPEVLDRAYKYTYAKVPLVNAKPLLQWIAEDLTEIHLEIRLHKLWVANLGLAVVAFQQAARNHMVMPFTLGSGLVLGKYVITTLKVKDEWMASNGNELAVNLSVDLLEWSGQLPIGVTPGSAAGLAVNLGLLTNATSAVSAQLIGDALLVKQLALGFKQDVKALAAQALRLPKMIL